MDKMSQNYNMSAVNCILSKNICWNIETFEGENKLLFVCVDTLNLTDSIVNSLVQLRLRLRWPRILAVSTEINVKVVLLNFSYTQTQNCIFYFYLFTWKLIVWDDGQ